MENLSALRHERVGAKVCAGEEGGGGGRGGEEERVICITQQNNPLQRGGMSGIPAAGIPSVRQRAIRVVRLMYADYKEIVCCSGRQGMSRIMLFLQSRRFPK